MELLTLCEGNSGFPSQRACNVELRSILCCETGQTVRLPVISYGMTIVWRHSYTYLEPCHFYPSALRAGGVLSSQSGRAGGCQTCGTHISVTAWWIFSIRSSVELSRPVGVHCHGHMPICPIWACLWAKNLSNLPQIGSRLCGTHISETAGWIYPI